MKTKIVYVLVSTNQDIYYEQALLSIYSLKLHQPNAHVVLFVDDITDKSLVKQRGKIKEYIDEIFVFNRPNGYTAKQTASYLKTHVRTNIDGDFLFIDTDTIICDKLDAIDSQDSLMSAVEDCHLSYKDHFGHKEYIRFFQNLDFEYDGDQYFNSGVIYCKDCKETREFYKKWGEYQMAYKDKCMFDQPLFAKVNNETNIVQELNGIWNCQIQYGLKYLTEAKIIHYFASNFIKSDKEYPYYFMDKDVLWDIKKEGCINKVIENKILNAKKQWGDKLEVIGGSTVDLQHSDTMKALQRIYFYKPWLFYIINNIIGKLGRLL